MRLFKRKITKWINRKCGTENYHINTVNIVICCKLSNFRMPKKKTELITNSNRKMFDEFLSDTFVDNTRNLYSFFTEMFSLRWVWVPSEYLAERCTSTIHSFVPYSCIYIHRFFTSLCLHFKTLTLSTVSRRMYLSACVLFSSLFSLAYYSRGLSLSVFVLSFFHLYTTHCMPVCYFSRFVLSIFVLSLSFSSLLLSFSVVRWFVCVYIVNGFFFLVFFCFPSSMIEITFLFSSNFGWSETETRNKKMNEKKTQQNKIAAAAKPNDAHNEREK